MEYPTSLKTSAIVISFGFRPFKVLLFPPPHIPPLLGHKTFVTPVLIGYEPVRRAALDGEQVEEAFRKLVSLAPFLANASMFGVFIDIDP